MSIILTLPWPPTANTYWRFVNNRVLISRKGREYRKVVARTVLRAHVAESMPIDGKLRVHVIATQTDKRRRDLDNLCKCLLDAMQHAGVYKDDGDIDSLYLDRDRAAKHIAPRVMVRVSKVGTSAGESWTSITNRIYEESLKSMKEVDIEVPDVTPETWQAIRSRLRAESRKRIGET